MSGGNYIPPSTPELFGDSLTSSRGRSSSPSAISDGWLNLHSLKRSKPVVLALGVITIVTVFVGIQFTIGEGGLDFRTAGKSGVVPKELLAGGWDGGTNGALKKWGNVSDVSQFVLGPPANSFRENLRPGVQYVTGWNAGGMTNIVMSFVHVIYTAMLSDRVAIVPPLSPDLAHIGGKVNQVPPINFGEIFDIPRLRKELNWPVLEWADIKIAAYDLPLSRETTPVPGAVMDELGCWGIRTVSRKENKNPGHDVLEMLLQLDCSYTVLPPDAVAVPDNYHVKVWSMVAALFPDGRKRILDNPKLSPQFPTQYGKKQWIAPDEQLAVFDNTYGVSSYVPYEWFQDFSPMWRFVASHLHFTPRLEGIADEYVRRMFGIGKDDAVQLYIVLHIRRGDWSKPCEENHPGNECAAPLSVFAARAEEVKRGLAEKYGSGSAQANVTAIVVTSDERDKKWWQSVADQGWYFVDYDKEETVKTLGRWYPSVIDSVIQSRAIGAVGVKGSTMSMMAERRVKDWNGGVAAEVQWNNGQGARRRRSEEPDDEEWYLDD